MNNLVTNNSLATNGNSNLSNLKIKGEFQDLFRFQCVQGMNYVLDIENKLRSKSLQLVGEISKSFFFEDKVLLNQDGHTQIKGFLNINIQNISKLKNSALKIYQDGSNELEVLNILLRRFITLYEKINKLNQKEKYKKSILMNLEAELRGILITYKEIFKSEKAGLKSIE
ncbi:MAG: hypothetical protein KC550_00460 [Nanoarchaeota archaeon]|nr:hypothetical protein [Nanoarchaeota archaeon]